MVKKIICIVCLFLFSYIGLFGQMVNKTYSDPRNGYYGTAIVAYYENELEGRKSFDSRYEIFKEMKPVNGFSVTVENKGLKNIKFTKEEQFLFSKALNEFDYCDNEVYSITISGYSSGPSTLNLLIKIQNGGR